jgi:large subunit ribosomal protein L28
MLKKCLICGKRRMIGHSLSRRGLAKKKGGTGKKTTRVNKRRFLPNLRKMRIVIKGRLEKAYICIKCLKAGKANVYTPKPRQT